MISSTISSIDPMYKGDLGIDEMNREIQMNFNPMYEKGLSMTYEIEDISNKIKSFNL